MPSTDELKQILDIKEAQPTQIVVILDRSGSMGTIKNDTIGGFNAFLDSQKALPDPAKITLITFSDNATIVYNKIDIQDAPPLTDSTYRPGGGTALYDTLGDAIKVMEDEQHEKALFVIMTDGEENTSKRTTSEELKSKISAKIEGGWEFIFIGANQDTILSARTLGITKSAAFSTHVGASGHADDTLRAYHVMGMSAMTYRSGGSFADVDGLHIDDDQTPPTTSTTSSN